MTSRMWAEGCKSQFPGFRLRDYDFKNLRRDVKATSPLFGLGDVTLPGFRLRDYDQKPNKTQTIIHATIFLLHLKISDITGQAS